MNDNFGKAVLGDVGRHITENLRWWSEDLLNLCFKITY